MLQYAAVYPRTLDLLKKLMLEPIFSSFNLVGGTALALQFGHRISIDLDLFTTDARLDKESIETVLQEIGELRQTNSNAVLYQAYLNDIKLDFVKYRYPLIRPVQEVEGIRMLHLEDIAAMKLSAITNRGAKKDFFDLYFLLQRYDLPTLLSFFVEKYPQQELFFVLKSLLYFDDAEIEIDPEMLVPLTWEEVKEYIENIVSAYLEAR